MTSEELKKLYQQDDRIVEICEDSHVLGEKIRIDGTVGAGITVIASAVMDTIGGIHMFLLPDKEEVLDLCKQKQELFREGEYLAKQ